ncbi:STAS domain-containing protein [Danxiaibacter flavus]|uniref:STAS domain-containing protein n=1 Tax=Danxiaibacter flavus TaxID=3049108 RepID=A0ABV3ZAI5_9BACT|nr:STAS domain-containing protein [Chitinophagaceae bacterium DXS]
MQVKIDTKEKFTVITPDVERISDKLTVQFTSLCINFLQKDIKNIILNMKYVNGIDEKIAQELPALQEKFAENKASFVVCEINKELEKQLQEYNVLELLNIVPSESEAWDIVQMDEIERELFNDQE